MELHGIDGAVSMEQRRKETAGPTEAVAVCHQATISKVSPTDDSVVLHHAHIDEFSNGRRSIWTPISLLLTNTTSRVNFYPFWAASLYYALWIGSRMVLTDV
jgi:hypothetical protein